VNRPSTTASSTSATSILFAGLRPDNHGLAYALDGETLSWASLDQRARSYAGALARAGVGRGDRVAIYVETCLELVVALFGNYYLGAIHVPINTRYRTAELVHILRDSQPAAVIGDAAGAAVLDEALVAAELGDAPLRVGVGQGAAGVAFAELLAGPPFERALPADDDAALMIYTSGTTGPSKGVVHSLAGVVANIHALTGLWTWTSRDRLVLALPLFHVHGLCIGVHGAAIHQLTVLLERRFDPAAIVARFADHERGRGTLFMGVPTMYAALVEHLEAEPEAAATLARGRLFCSGSAALSPALWARFEALTGERILERYGMSETLITLTNPYLGPRKPGAVGRPVPGCEAAVVDEHGDALGPGETGELIVRSNGIMRGYWKLPEASAASFVDGREGRRWFLTGDVAYVDEDGDFHIAGRKSVDIIKSGGFKISSLEIEQVLEQAPEVAEVAIIGIDDPKWGQRIVACVRPSASAPADPDALLDALIEVHNHHLAAYKKPRGLLICEALPRNALGKLQKHRLLDQVAREGLTAER